MLSVRGIYDGKGIKLSEKIETSKPVEVIITFLEELNTPITKKGKKYSFYKSQELLKDLKTSLSSSVIQERDESK